MADALCGPSNALQSFSKHTQIDRTLQQDRLVGRQSPAQGFRTHDPRTGSLDADFHAFEHSHADPFQFQFQQQPQAPPHFAQPSPVAPAVSGWAADFQRLQISNSPSPISAQHLRTEAPLIRSQVSGGINGWHNEFMQHHGKGKEVAATPQQQQQYAQNTAMFNAQPSYAMGMQSYSPFQQQPMQEAPTAAPIQTDEAMTASFDAAFDEAMREMEAYQQELEQPQHSEQQPQEELPQQQQIRIGSDTINYNEQKSRTPEQANQDADDLARTAGHLLNLVSHDTSDKFQNSAFLGLMRKIRDREVEVQNNDLQATTSPGISSTETPSQITAHPPPLDQTTAQQPFTFPDLNDVYAPTQTDDDNVPLSSWQTARPANTNASDADAMYTVGADEYPSTSAGRPNENLHPGGPWYPEQKSPPQMNGNGWMAGALGQGQA